MTNLIFLKLLQYLNETKNLSPALTDKPNVNQRGEVIELQDQTMATMF